MSVALAVETVVPLPRPSSIVLGGRKRTKGAGDRMAPANGPLGSRSAQHRR
jgi:hypothetical protein